MLGTDKTGQPQAHNLTLYYILLSIYTTIIIIHQQQMRFYAEQLDTKWSYPHKITEMCITVILQHGNWYSSIHKYLLETTTTTYCASHSQILTDVKDVHIIPIIIWTPLKEIERLHFIRSVTTVIISDKWRVVNWCMANLKLSALSLAAGCVCRCPF